MLTCGLLHVIAFSLSQQSLNKTGDFGNRDGSLGESNRVVIQTVTKQDQCKPGRLGGRAQATSTAHGGSCPSAMLGVQFCRMDQLLLLLLLNGGVGSQLSARPSSPVLGQPPWDAQGPLPGYVLVAVGLGQRRQDGAFGPRHGHKL